MKRKNTFIYNYGMGATLAAQFHLEYPPVDEEVFLETNKTNKINLGAYYVGKVSTVFSKNAYNMIGSVSLLGSWKGLLSYL